MMSMLSTLSPYFRVILQFSVPCYDAMLSAHCEHADDSLFESSAAVGFPLN